MTTSLQIAKHVRDFHSGGNYTGVNLKDTIADITWQESTTSIHSLNSIAALVFHINYYITAVLKVLRGHPLDAHDKYSYDLPPIENQEDWDKLREKVLTDAEQFAGFIEQLPESQVNQHFIDGKYGTYFRNLEGAIEHAHYHLGQIAIIKKMLRQKPSPAGN